MVRIPRAELNLPTRAGLVVRPVVASDRRLIEVGYQQLSERSRYLRFFTGADKLSPTKLSYLSNVDFVDHVALGVLDGKRPVAVGRWVRMADPVDADVALTVLDDHQGQGIGSALMTIMADAAGQRGVRRLHFDVLAENRAMLRLLEHHPWSEIERDETVVHIVIDAGEVPPPPVDPDQIRRMIDWGAAHAGTRSTKRSA